MPRQSFKILAACLATAMAPLPSRVFAQGTDHMDRAELAPSQRAQNLQFGLSRGAEYSAGTYPGEVLLPIYLIGSVARPGIYNLPKKTELLKLLTLAGGVGPQADTEHITVKRRINTEEKVYQVDLDGLLRTAGKKTLYMESGDIVFVPGKEPFISQDTSGVITLVATLLSITTTAVLLSTALDK